MDTINALDFFLPNVTGVRVTSLGQGNINDTWRVDLPDGQKQVLQRLHPAVFPDPAAVMANIGKVTEHLRRMAPAPPLVFFSLITNPEGKEFFLDTRGHCWRLLTYIDNTRTLDSLQHAGQAQEIGALLGNFHLLTAGINPDALADPLPDFHITPRYLEHYDAIRGNSRNTNRQEAFCVDNIENMRPTATLLEQTRKELTNRVIHGDPKITNILFAMDTDQAVSLIDFDTVKPGLLLHDLGDCLRSCCNRCGEVCQDPSAAVFDADFFQALLTGYMQPAGHLLGPTDRKLLVEAIKLISFELALRFFTDHLNGDQYFKVTQKGQNLDRALIQFHLNRSISKQQTDLEQRFSLLCGDAGK